MDQCILQAIFSLKEAIVSLTHSAPLLQSFSSVATIIGAIFVIIKFQKEFRHQQIIFLEGQNLKEREAIRYRLDNFFAPLKELRSESRELYRIFAKNEKDHATLNNEPLFRTLRHLSQGKNFSEQDQSILNEILLIGKKQLILIEEKGCISDNPNLAELLGIFGAHTRLLSIASEHKLDGISDKLEEIVFPLEVDGAIESEIRKLRDQYELLLKDSTETSKSFFSSKEQGEIVSYYDRIAEQYFRETAYIDMKDEYTRFRKFIPLAGTILDAGCGVGRDTRYFIKKGYRVISFDASSEMVNICRRYPFAYCQHKSFNMIDYIEEFDGVWACASLIHLPPDEFKKSLFRLANATKQGGIIYFSLKDGNGITNDKGKITYYHQDSDIRKIMIEELMFEFIDSWSNEGRKIAEPSCWTNYLFKKPRPSQ